MIGSVQKALKILNVLSNSRGCSVPLGKLAEKTGINKATCAHLIETLEAEGYALKISPSKGYILGPAAYCLTSGEIFKKELVKVCRPVVNYLYETLGYCVVLAVMENKEKYIIDYKDNGKVFKEKKQILRDDIYRTATGRALLINIPDSEICDIYEKFGPPAEDEWPKVRTLKDILEQKKSMSSTDVIISRKVYDDVALGYAVPFFDALGCVGAVGIAVNISPEEEKDFGEKEEKIKEVLKKGAREITRRLKAR